MSSKKKKGPSKPRKIKLAVIPKPEPDTRAVLIPSPGVLVVKGPSIHEPPMVCGECETHLMEGVRRGTMDGVVIRCPSCGAYNDTP